MTYKNEAELRRKAMAFAQALQSANIATHLEEMTFRDYNVKLTVPDAGRINIYYSPKRDQYTLKLHELKDKALSEKIERCWQMLHGDATQPVTEQPDAVLKGYAAYVDGSFLGGVVGYGAVVLHDDSEVTRFSGHITEHVEQQQVGGELAATMRVLAWCQQHDIPQITIFYDYKGIENWATGAWKANKPNTRAYRDFVKKSPVRVKWRKVKSHSGNKWNDVADELAKAGAQSGDAPEPDAAESELEAIALKFVNFLADHDLEAAFTRILNGQYARIVIGQAYFDLYNTRNRPLEPYLHNFKSRKQKARIEQLWTDFKQTKLI